MLANHPLAAPFPGGLAVGSAAQATRHMGRYEAMLTIEDPSVDPRHAVRAHARHGVVQLVLRFDDVDRITVGARAPDTADAEAILAFGRTQRNKSLLVHCLMGVARSTAAALGILADRMGAGREDAAVAELVRLRPCACPNLVLAHALDRALGRDGALMEAVMVHESGRPGLQALRDRRHRTAGRRTPDRHEQDMHA